MKTTLGKMVATNTLPSDFINLHFWESWPRRFYNIKSYDASKIELSGPTEDVESQDDLPPTQFNKNYGDFPDEELQNDSPSILSISVMLFQYLN